MKKVIPIIMFLGFLTIISCRQPKIFCGPSYPLPDGTGMDSKLNRFESVAFMDTVAAMIDLEINLLQPWKGIKEERGIGVVMAVNSKGEEKGLRGGVTDVNGRLKLFVNPGVYELEFSYTLFNTLLVKNVSFMSGGIYEIEVTLGGQGKERKTFVVDITEEQEGN